MDCSNALAKLYEYIDGEIGHVEREAIADHIEACRNCFDQFETERVFAEFVERRVPRPEARSEFKSHLLARLAEEASVQSRPSTSSGKFVTVFNRFAIAAGLILTVGAGAAWLQKETGPQRLPWRTLAGYHHERLAVEEIGLETNDYSQARAFLAAQLSPSLASLLPESAPPGVGTQECCVMPWCDSKLGRLAFEGGSAGEISLFIIPASSFQFSDEARIRVDNRNYRSVKLGCCRAVCWDDGSGYVCVMLGDCGANDLLAYAQSWQSLQPRHSLDGSSLPVDGAQLSIDSSR